MKSLFINDKYLFCGIFRGAGDYLDRATFEGLVFSYEGEVFDRWHKMDPDEMDEIVDIEKVEVDFFIDKFGHLFSKKETFERDVFNIAQKYLVSFYLDEENITFVKKSLFY